MVNDITKRNQTEEALRDANQFNIEIVSQAGEGIVVYDRDLRYVVWNQFMERMTGAAAGDVIGRNALDLFQHLHEQGVDKLLKRALNGETVTSPDIQFYSTFSDKKGWVTGTYSPHRNARGEIIGVIATLRDITERKRAEEELKRTQSSIRIAMDLVKLVRWEYDVETDMFTFDDQFYALYGTTAEREGGPLMSSQEYARKFIPAEDASIVAKEISKALATTDPNYSSQLEHRIIRADGTERVIAVRFGIIKDIKGRTIRTYGANQDITESKRAEEASRESEQRLANIIDFLPDATFAVDREGKVIAWNQAIEEMTGIAKDDMLNRGSYAYAVPFYGEPRPILIDLVFQDQKEIESTYTNILRKGDRIVAEVSTPLLNRGKGAYLWGIAAPLYDRSGSIIGAIESIRDITDRKREQEELQNNLRFRETMINTIPSPIFVKDKQGRYLGCNDTFAREIVGLPKESIIGKSVYELSETIPSGLADRYREQDQELFRKPGIQVYETQAQCADGVRRDFLFSKATFNNFAGEVAGIVGVMLDITERKQMEAALRESRDFLDKIINSIGDPIFVIDRQHRHVLVNDALCELTNRTREEFIGKTPYNFYPKEQVDVFLQKDEVVFETGKENVNEETITDSHGVIRTIVTKKTLYTDASGNKSIVGIIRDITDRKKAEEELRRSEEHLRLAVEGGELGTYTHDFISGQGYWSSELKAFYGLGADEPLVLDEDGVAIALHPEDRSAFLSAMIAANDPYGNVDGVLELDYRIIRTDGSIRWLRVHGLTEFIGESNNRHPWRAAGVVTDVTERKKAEDALKESRARQELAIQSAQMGSWVLDVVENKRDFDAQTCHLLGIDHATFKGSPDEFFRVVHPNDLDAIEAALTLSIEQDAPYESAYRVIHPDGSIRHIVARGRVIRDQNRRPLKLIGIIWDDTKHKQAEEALRTSHQILDGIINTIPVRVFWKDRDLVFLGCNAIFAQDAGFADSKDIVGKDDYQMGWRDQAELYRSDDRQVIESGRPKLLIEEPQTTPEGRTIVLLTSKMPLRSSEGEIIGVLGTYMDITERKRMESELRRSRDELELRVKERTEELARKNAEMERFTYTVSHDLRSPLVTVSGFVGLLKEDLEKGDSQHAFSDLTTINESITKMDRLLVDTLELSRIGRVINPPEDVPFGQIVQEALRQTGEKIKSGDVAVYMAGDMPKVRVDVLRIIEVLVNLIENSVKYMGDQERPEIDIGSRKDGEEIVFFVKDNGMGIDPNEHEKVFGLFYKVDRTSEGTGAGLAIVKRIIEVHGGRIWIESELGKGCTVCFTLPLVNVG